MRDRGVGRERAEQAVAARFSRLMNASTSRFGVLSDPAMAGVPLKIPSAPTERPGGTDPVASNEYGGVPSFAWKACEYAVPTCAAGSGHAVTMVGAAGRTVTLHDCENAAPVASRTVRVNVPVPGAAGVPVTRPEGASVSPAGRDPPSVHR